MPENPYGRATRCGLFCWKVIGPLISQQRVTLLGDSIRLGYEPTVRESLAGTASIWSHPENCMHSVHHLFNLDPWYLKPPASLIHMNFGLWDCRRISRHVGGYAVPVDVFARNLDYILGAIRVATPAMIVWATITPVVEARYNARFLEPFAPCRIKEDVEIYNAAAAPILRRHGVVINDLNAFVQRQGAECMICEDGVHFSSENYALLGNEVARVIRETLAASGERRSSP